MITGDRREQILTGIMLGDGNYRPDSKYQYLRISCTNEAFIRWLSSELGDDIVSSVTYTPYKRAKDQWLLRSRRHPLVEQFKSWYETGEKRYPKELVITPLVTKIWYCGDGTNVKDRDEVRIYCYNEEERLPQLAQLFEDEGLNPRVCKGRLSFTSELLDWMGLPPDGMAYKWE